MGTIIMELHSSWTWIAIKLQWVAPYMQWVATHATCLLALMTYKYNELQVSSTTQKLSYKANCKTHFFLIVNTKVLNQKLQPNYKQFCVITLIVTTQNLAILQFCCCTYCINKKKNKKGKLIY